MKPENPDTKPEQLNDNDLDHVEGGAKPNGAEGSSAGKGGNFTAPGDVAGADLFDEADSIFGARRQVI